MLLFGAEERRCVDIGSGGGGGGGCGSLVNVYVCELSAFSVARNE